MKIVLAPDSFKGSLSAVQACEAIERGVRRVVADAEVVSVPMADGGEGTVEALVGATGGQIRRVRVHGPLGEKVEARYGVIQAGGKTGVIEMAAACGLPLVAMEKRNPLHTTTYGLGEMILDGLHIGMQRFVIGVGGSATNDCGCGMAQALGVAFENRQWEVIHELMNGSLAGQVAKVECGGLDERLAECEFVVACDVTNPLLGENGASYVYGPQKGAGEVDVVELEANMAHVIGLIESATGRSVRDAAGAGAAGGLGAGLMAFLDAKLQRGVEIVLRYSGFEEKIRDADLIITGEGRIDRTTVQGKTLSGIAKAAKAAGVPVVALAGSVGEETDELFAMGIKAILPICNGPMTLETAMAAAPGLLEAAAARVMRFVKT